MIIPLVSAKSPPAPPPVERAGSIADRLRHWGLFGKVALIDGEQVPETELIEIIQQVGGEVELLVVLAENSLLEGISLLNAGAIGIVGNQPTSEKIPAKCWHFFERPLAGKSFTSDLIKLDAPAPTVMADFTCQGKSSLVNAAWLDQHPEQIVDYLDQILVSDREDRLWPTLVVDSLGLALGLAYSNRASLLDAIQHRRGTYWSRSRNGLWIKGATSGAVQRLLGIRWDCDRDCLRFQVQQQSPGFCHLDTHSCFGEERTILSVIQRLQQRIFTGEAASFTQKLARDPKMLRKKLLEEAEELAEAESLSHTAFEAADVLYFALVKMLSKGVSLEQVYQELFRRMSRIERRPNKLEMRE